VHREKLFWKWLLYFNWGVIFFFWFKGSGSLLGGGLPSIAIALGRLSGLSAAYMILLQFFFMGRMPYLERVFGLDTLSRLHHTNGNRGIILLILHPILLVLGYSAISGLSLWGQFVEIITDYRHVIWAFVGFILFLTVVGVSIYIVRLRIRYESWYFVHLLAYLAVFSSFWHQIAVGEDIIGNKLFYGYWVFLYIIVFTSHITFRFIRPIYLFLRHRFSVARILREAPDAVSIYIKGRALDRFFIRPGQFMIFRFLKKGMWWQAHPFSLSMVPNGKEIRITVRELGDFTKQLQNVPLGTPVFIDGPYGVFTDIFGLSQKTLFIAGGIGITPIRSLMEEMLIKGKDAALLYSNKLEKRIVFKNELQTLKEKYQANIVHILSDEQPKEAGEEYGYIDEEKIRRLVPDVAHRDVFLCGPPPMMEKLVIILKGLGVTPKRIHFERFSL